MVNKIVNDCQLEIDRVRGVVYVHSPMGNTLVRICRIPPAVLDQSERALIDVVYDRELAKGFIGIEALGDGEL